MVDKNNQIKNCEVWVRNIDTAQEIWVKDISELKGKPAQDKPTVVASDRIKIQSNINRTPRSICNFRHGVQDAQVGSSRVLFGRHKESGTNEHGLRKHEGFYQT